MTEVDLFGQLQANLHHRDVSIVEFAEAPEFCGRALYPRQKLLLKLIFLEDLTPEEERILDYWESGGANGNEISIGPFVRQRIAYLKENGYQHFRRIVLVGGRRSSKGFLTGLCMAKKVYDALQYQDPNRHYGIDPDKEIIYACIAASQQQAQEQQYADFAGMVNSCFSLQPHISKMQELEFSLATQSDMKLLEQWKRQGRKVQRDISKIRGRALPANARTIRGLAAMAICFDEFAHFLQGESDQSDSSVYGSALPSLTQFGREALIFCNSSPYSKIGKFYEVYEEGMAIENGAPADPLTLAIRMPSWALYEGWWDDPSWVGSTKPQRCQVVSADWDENRLKDPDDPSKGFFYTTDDRQAILIERQEEAADPIKYKVEKRSHFAEVMEAYLNPLYVDRMFSGIPSSDGTQYKALTTNIANPMNTRQYCAHLDPSSTTAGFGFALGHIEELVIGEETEQHVVFDIIHRWDPSDYTDHVIDWEPILNEIVVFADLFRPFEITMDQHQSRFPITWLQRELRNRKISETRVYEKTATSQGNWDRAEVFKTALYRNLVHGPHDTPQAQHGCLELKYLQEIRTGRTPRVEKQDVGPIQTKDVADAMMVVVEALIGNTIAREARSELASSPLAGAQGGYAIGRQRPGGGSIEDFYGGRSGEQAVPGGARGRGQGSGRSPARRPGGGRPIGRRLPGW